MSFQRIRPLIAVFIVAAATWLLQASPSRAQYVTFTKSTITTAPISFDFGNGFSGTITFSGATAGSSGLYNPTTSGTTLSSSFLLVAPGSVATFTFNQPMTRLDLSYGTGLTGARTERFSFNTSTGVRTQNVNNNSTAIRNQNFRFGTSQIYGFSVSSTSANPLRFSARGTSVVAVAPLSPLGATLLGNLVAIGAILLYRRRRASKGAGPSVRGLVPC